MREIFGRRRLESVLHYRADTFASVWLRNDGGSFSVHPLPPAAQISPIHAILAEDLDGDGALDLLLAGSLLHTEPNTPPLDAGKGLFVRGNGSGAFQPLSPTLSGFLAPDEARDLAVVRTPAGSVVVVGHSGGEVRAVDRKSVVEGSGDDRG